LNIKIVSPVDTSVAISPASVYIYPNDNSNNSEADAWIETTTSPASFAMSDGSYTIEISPNDNELASNLFTATFSGGTTVVKFGDETLTPISGVYYLPLRKPHMKGVVKAPDGSLVRYSQIAIYSGSDTYPRWYSNTDSAGRFSVNLGSGEITVLITCKRGRNGERRHFQTLPEWQQQLPLDKGQLISN
jgi:hypothetical protein